jgi:uncharacterized membrane protein
MSHARMAHPWRTLMKRDYSVPMAVQMAEEVMNMHHELQRLREENAELREYRDKYMQELDNSIAHSHHMMGGLLQLALKPGALDAIAASNAAAPLESPL